ncbi:putative N-acetyltransferase (plasmid) [Carnobacterium sp. 17-4]|uniref:GNAT family N-acetyltransferase n=1 Tax=Carnobacterium sp. (strain 17-4) TaxID=208596 RepID=UPI0002058495|nr:GNAT family N-acetyltransferase [Carnobacterium sp. 17-4]AEB31199.1 putative N-acetyltransferase [Carnobacterium sp. 17-4]
MNEGRINIRKIEKNDFKYLKELLQDEQLMILGWGKIYPDNEVNLWIDKIREQYAKYGYSYFLIENKDTNEFIGIAGLIQTEIKNSNCTELAYIIKKTYQGKGFGSEVARKLILMAFNEFNLNKVVAQFVPSNIASKKVVETIGMTYKFTYTRIQNGSDKEHFVYEIKK